jgi:hypothetical protein
LKPRADRPEIPSGYGVESATDFVPWESVESRLIHSIHYWVATTRPNGAPHVVPRWGVWIDSRFWYDGSIETKHVRNLEQEDRCVLHLESGESAVIVEGRSARAAPVLDDFGRTLSEEFHRKYAKLGYRPEPDAWSDEIAGGLRVIEPAKVLAWNAFPTDLTRFTF